MVPATVDVLPPSRLNTRAYLDLNDLARRTGWAHGFMHTWALWAGLATLSAMVVAAYLWGRRSPDPARAAAACLLTAVAALVGLLVNLGLGHAAGELRPYVTHPHALTLVARANDFSFPSDHSVVAGAIAGGLTIVSWRWGLVAWLLALFLAFARVYVGAHYPGDVVAGLAVGAIVAFVLDALLLRPTTRLADRLTRTALAPLVASRTSSTRTGQPVG